MEQYLLALLSFVHNSAFRSNGLLFKGKPFHVVAALSVLVGIQGFRASVTPQAVMTRVSEVLVNFDECSVDEYCTVPMQNWQCPQIFNASRKWESQCAKCSVHPSLEPNHLNCKTCALDNTLRLPMCTSCEGGWTSLVYEVSKLSWLCLEPEIHPDEVPALCSENPIRLVLPTYSQAWWKFQDKEGNYVYKLVHLSELEEKRGNSSRGGPSYVFIRMRVFQTANTFMKNEAESEYVFQLQKTDSWMRHPQNFKRYQEPADEEMMVWYLDKAFETEHKQLEVQVGFVKTLWDSMGDEELNVAAWKEVPKMRFKELTMQALGSCFDFWLKRGRLPPPDLYSKSAESIWHRVSQFFDYQDVQRHRGDPVHSHEHPDPNRCPVGMYCTFGPHNAACTPPGRCLPCNQDDNGHENGLLCSICSLSTRAGLRYSVPGCHIDWKPTCDEGQTAKMLVDDTDVRWRWYCRPATYTPGEKPMLCKKPEQGGFHVASPGVFWLVQGKGRKRTLNKRVRFLSHEHGQAYIVFFPRTESMHEESVAFYAGASLFAEQMLMVQFSFASDSLLYVPGNHEFADEGAMFKYHGMTKLLREAGKSFHTLSFNTEVTVLNITEEVEDADEPENMLFFLSDDALLELTACFESFISDGPPESPSPLSGLRERLLEINW